MKGPGDCLQLILESFGIHPQNCECKIWIERMNRWNIEGCLAHKQEIVQYLREQQVKYGWVKTLIAAKRNPKLAWQLNWLDPAPSIVDLAISMAKELSDE